MSDVLRRLWRKLCHDTAPHSRLNLVIRKTVPYAGLNARALRGSSTINPQPSQDTRVSQYLAYPDTYAFKEQCLTYTTRSIYHCLIHICVSTSTFVFFTFADQKFQSLHGFIYPSEKHDKSELPLPFQSTYPILQIDLDPFHPFVVSEYSA
ncbi:hypothetical protein YC2023_031425 [Brassica napus]